MAGKRLRSAAYLIAAFLVVATSALGQSGELRLKARLSPVPVESSTASTITGKGAATAVLTGNVLEISGTFEGMKSPATIAQVHIGQRGVRGPVEFDLTITKAPSGTFSGSPRLSRVQIDSLKKGWFYIQIHSESAPDGNLWGWLLS
jgi:CHRD domain